MWIFNPIFKQTIWGGNRLFRFKHMDSGLENVGESWELSGVAGSESTVADGPDVGLTLPQLIDRYGASLMGSRNFEKYGNRFPLLIKFIDACDDLSVQVHPDDAMARKQGEPNGKSEMWYVLEADKGARLANGFRNPVDPADYDSLLATGKIEETLNFMNIKPGEVYFIPAGRVHAISRGSFVVEIQQTSDATYRIYDYHRKDKNGNERQLHTELAREAVDFNDTDGNAVKYNAIDNIPVNLIRTQFFTTNILNADSPLTRDYGETDSFIALICVDGSGTIKCGDERRELHQGMTLLIPASAKTLEIIPTPRISLLETYL